MSDTTKKGWRLYLEEEQIREAFALTDEAAKAVQKEEQFTLYCNFKIAWAAIRLIDADGFFWVTKDFGATWTKTDEKEA